jgi:hypothetical protein
MNTLILPIVSSFRHYDLGNKRTIFSYLNYFHADLWFYYYQIHLSYSAEPCYIHIVHQSLHTSTALNIGFLLKQMSYLF